MSRFSRPVPLWLLLIAIILTGSVVAGATILPTLLTPKPDFVISLSNNPLIVFAQNPDGNSTSTEIDSVRNFTGVVSVQWNSPNGLGIPTYPSSSQILLGKTGKSPLTVVGHVVGNYTVLVIASSGSLVHSVSLIVRVTNVTITPSPSALTIGRGSSGTSEISLTSINGFDNDLYASSGAYSFDGQYWNAFDGTITTAVTPYISSVPPNSTIRAVLSINVSQGSMVGQRQVIVQMSLATVKLRSYLWLTVT